MSGGRFGGFRSGKTKILRDWDDRKSNSASVAAAPSNIFEFDYTTAQGIWTLGSTVQFPKRILYAGNTSSTTTSINMPSGLQGGDIVIVATYLSGSTPATPTGYTLGQSGFTNSVGYMWAYKRMGGVPDTTAGGLSAGVSVAAVFRYVNVTTPIDSIATAISGTSGMPDCPEITTVKDRSTIVALGFLDNDVVASSVYFPKTYTLIGAYQYGTAGTGGTIMAAYYNQPAAGKNNPDVFTGTGTDAWVGTTFALRA
jgi:hypothetical protein